MKFLRPTNSPGLPTLMLDSENHTPITNGYAMNAPSRTTVGLRRANARSRSFSRRRSKAGRLPEYLKGLVDLGPHWVVFPLLGGADAVTLVDLKPLSVVRVLVQPLQEVLGELLVLRVLHHGMLEGQVQGELTSRALRYQ